MEGALPSDVGDGDDAGEDCGILMAGSSGCRSGSVTTRRFFRVPRKLAATSAPEGRDGSFDGCVSLETLPAIFPVVGHKILTLLRSILFLCGGNTDRTKCSLAKPFQSISTSQRGSVNVFVCPREWYLKSKTEVRLRRVLRFSSLAQGLRKLDPSAMRCSAIRSSSRVLSLSSASS